MKVKNKSAFTLVEMFIVVTIFSMVSVAIGGIFISGMNLWKRVKDEDALAAMQMLDVEALTQRVRRSNYHYKNQFVCMPKKLSFISLFQGRLYRYTYWFDALKKKMFYKRERYKEKGYASLKKTSLFSAEDILFTYLVKNKLEDNDSVWQKKVKENQILIAVKIWITKKLSTSEKSIYLME